MRTVLLKEMSTSKELVELNELYKNIQLQELGPSKDLVNTNQEKNDKKNQKDRKKIPGEFSGSREEFNKKYGLNDDDKDDKNEIKGPNINTNKKDSNKKDSDKSGISWKDMKDSGMFDKKDSDKDGGSTTSGTIDQQDHHQSKVIDQFKKEQKRKEDSDDEKGANEWGPDGQPSASKQIDAYKKGRPSPASFKTNQRQTRELIKKQSKEVYPSVTKKDLNQFNRTKKYSADDGSQVERSTVFTKHYKTGKPLGVMTGSQRKAYDKAAAAYKAQPTPTPKAVETKPVETKPDTYKTNLGAFLNNKKKGDVKDKSRHTKVASVLDIEDSYDAKGDDSLNERMAIGGANPNERLGQIARDAISKTKVGGLVDKVLQSKSKTYKKARDADKKIAANAKDQNWKRTDTGHATDAIETSGKDRGKITRGELRNSEIKAGPEAAVAVSAPAKKKKTTSYAAMSSESYDAYDLVLDYIMESKQASSIEEANYIMMEMDQNTIHEIVQVQKKSLDEGLAKLVGLGAAGYGLWKAGKWAKKKGDKALDDARKNMKIGGENRKKEIEQKSGVDLSNW